jgi:hypothetical protein
LQTRSLGRLPSTVSPRSITVDQEAQFTSHNWIKRLEAAGVGISMGDEGRLIPNLFIERLCRNVNYNEVYLRSHANGSKARESLSLVLAKGGENALDDCRPVLPRDRNGARTLVG